MNIPVTLVQITELSRRMAKRAVPKTVPHMAAVRSQNARMLRLRRPRLVIRCGTPCYLVPIAKQRGFWKRAKR